MAVTSSVAAIGKI